MRFTFKKFVALVVIVGGFTLWKLYFAATNDESIALRLAQCPAIADVSPRPFGEQDFSGAEKKVSSGAFEDIFLSDREGRVSAGIRPAWGASLIFFGDKTLNVLDSSALGRGIFLKFHSQDFTASQAGNECGTGTAVDALTSSPLTATVSPLIVACPKGVAKNSGLRINQILHFVKPGVLEIEYAITNFSAEATMDESSELPALHASDGARGSLNLDVMRNARGKVLNADEREPTSLEDTPDGWASFADSSDEHGVGIYWENRNSHPRPGVGAERQNGLRSNFGFTVPGQNTAHARVYLLLGGYEKVREQVLDLDKSIPPFGRIDLNRIEEDTRTVSLHGWALDNKDVTALELWVDGKKVSNLKFNSQRDDVCAAHPGYSMCDKSHSRVGFETTYARPEGDGCPRPVEVRAQDSDGNWRVIARNSISPVLH